MEVNLIKCFFFFSSSENVDVWNLKVNALGVENFCDVQEPWVKRRSRPQPLLPETMARCQVIQGVLELAPEAGKWSRKMGIPD